VSDLESSEVVVPGKRVPSEQFAPEVADAPASNPPRGEREGLPSSYRMRADSHYVEQLTGRRAERGDRTERAAERDRERGEHARVVAAQDAEDVDARDKRGERIMAQLSEELATLASGTAMLSNTSALARRLGVDLVRVETWRANWLVRAHALVEGRDRALLRPRHIGPLAEQVRVGLGPECRLAGASLQVTVSDWNASVNVDEPVLLAGITGAVLATLGLVGQQESTVVRVAFETSNGELRAVEVSQDDATPAASAGVRFFDLAWADRPGGWLAGLGAVTARAAAQQHGGNAIFQAGDRRGSLVRITFGKLH
jgi:hypothetical protein